MKTQYKAEFWVVAGQRNIRQNFGLSQIERTESITLSWHRSKVDETEVDSRSRRSTSYRTTEKN